MGIRRNPGNGEKIIIIKPNNNDNNTHLHMRDAAPVRCVRTTRNVCGNECLLGLDSNSEDAFIIIIIFI